MGRRPLRKGSLITGGSDTSIAFMIRIFLVCSGLGRTRRGYEAFIQDLHGVLIDEPDFDVLLFKGGGKSNAVAKALWNLPQTLQARQPDRRVGVAR